MINAMRKCSPRNGVNEAKTPAATPAEIACGDAVSRKMRFETYLKDRVQLRRGHSMTRSFSALEAGLFRPNSIYETGSRFFSVRFKGYLVSELRQFIHIMYVLTLRFQDTDRVQRLRLPGFVAGSAANSGGS